MKVKEADVYNPSWYAVYYAKSKTFVRNHEYAGMSKIIYIIW